MIANSVLIRSFNIWNSGIWSTTLLKTFNYCYRMDTKYDRYSIIGTYITTILWQAKMSIFSEISFFHQMLPHWKIEKVINQKPPWRPGVVGGTPDRCLHCDGCSSTPVFCNAEQWWHRLARPFIDVVLPWFTRSTSVTPSVHGADFHAVFSRCFLQSLSAILLHRFRADRCHQQTTSCKAVVLQWTLTTVGCEFLLPPLLHHLQSSHSPTNSHVVRAFFIIFSRNILNNTGDNGHPRRTPTLVQIKKRLLIIIVNQSIKSCDTH